jgi:signal transduction histidine kinase
VQAAYVFLDQFGAIAWMMFVADGILIIMAAAIGTRMMVIGLALTCSCYMVAVLLRYYLANGQDTTAHHELLGTILSGLLIVAALATYTLLLQGGFYRMARDTGNMQYAIDQGRQLDALKDQFIITVNHELRNPIMALTGNLDTLHRAWPRLTEAERLEFVDGALVAGKNVRSLLESILDIRRIEVAEQFTPMAVDVRAALDVAIRLIAPGQGAMIPRDILVTIPAGLAIWGDATRLQQILTNLLSNAIKYSEAGTSIEVTAQIPTTISPRKRPHAPQMVEITIKDYGLGIPPQQIPLLFQRFVRLPRDLASNVMGNGLGLYLCREYAQAMQGDIGVESTGIAGEGSTFRLVLPLTSTSSPPLTMETRPLAERV